MERTYDATVVQQVFDNLPEWLKNASPQFTEAWITANGEGEGYLLSHPDITPEQHPSVYEAYEAADVYGFSVAFGKSLFADGVVSSIMQDDDEYTPEEAYAYHLVNSLIVRAHDVSYAMFSTTFAAWVYGMQKDFDDFDSIRARYLQHPKSFEAACEFVEEHPIAWIRPGRQKSAAIWMPHNDNTLVPYFADDEGNPGEFWLLETGEHEDPTYERRYFDPKLSVFDASSPAEAYVRVAANIEATFHPDGTRKDN